MGNALDNITVGQLMGVMGGLVAIYAFCKNLIVPLVVKWMKIDKAENDIATMKSWPMRIEALEEKAERDYKRLNAMDNVNVLMMEALRALIRNRRTNNDVSNLASVEGKIDDFLTSKGVRSE